MNGPDPGSRTPLGADVTRLGFLRDFITRANIDVGDYRYYGDPLGPHVFEDNVLYHFDFAGGSAAGATLYKTRRRELLHAFE